MNVGAWILCMIGWLLDDLFAVNVSR